MPTQQPSPSSDIFPPRPLHQTTATITTRRRRPPRSRALTDLPPLRIIRSILLLQTSYYVAAVVLVFFSTAVLGQPFRVGLVLDWREVRGDVTVGWVLGVVWLLVGFVTVIPILLLVHRSKLVPDFALTIHLLHTAVTSFYTHTLPTNLLWWSLQGASAFLMVSLGVWACRYREMKPISFGVPSAATAAGTTAGPAITNGRTRKEERNGGGGGGSGSARSGLGRRLSAVLGWGISSSHGGKDGGGAYELVGAGNGGGSGNTGGDDHV